jgi:hypothetical protein
MIKTMIPITIVLTVNLVANACFHGKEKKIRKWNFFQAVFDTCIWLLLLWTAGVFND